MADLNIHVQRGRIYGLPGRNGVGRITTMKMLPGLTQPTSGKVTIWEKSLPGNEKKLLPRIGSLIESLGFYPHLAATENLRIFAALRGLKNQNAIKIPAAKIVSAVLFPVPTTFLMAAARNHYTAAYSDCGAIQERNR